MWKKYHDSENVEQSSIVLVGFCMFIFSVTAQCLCKSQKTVCKLREEKQKITGNTDHTHLPVVHSLSEILLNQDNGKDLILNQFGMGWSNIKLRLFCELEGVENIPLPKNDEKSWVPQNFHPAEEEKFALLCIFSVESGKEKYI